MNTSLHFAPVSRRCKSALGSWLLLAALIPSCKKAQVEAPPEIRPVRYMEVLAGDAIRDRSFAGVAKAGVESSLSFRVSGTLIKLLVDVGDTVEKGQTIAVIDAADFKMQVQQARAALSQARAQERNQKAVYERTRKLYENQNASKSDLDAARAGFESAKAQVASARQQLGLSARQQEYTVLKAPAKGSIASRDAEVNENVSAGQKIVMLTAGENIDIEVGVPEGLISQIKKDQEVEVTVGSIPDAKFKGLVNEVGVASVGGATTFPVTVRLQEGQERVRPGMAAEVRFKFTRAGDSTIILPSFVVRNDREGTFVFSIEKTGEETAKLHRKKIGIGEMTEEGIEIKAGLEGGELLVTAGVSRVSDGQTVKLLERHRQQP